MTNEFIFADWNGKNITVYADMIGENEFRYKGTFECDGSEYKDTGVKLFSNENAHRNFRISFEFDTNSNIAGPHDTIMSSIYEIKSIKWPGVVFRIDNNDVTKHQLSAGNSSTTVNRQGGYNSHNTVVILRVNDIIYYKINGGAYQEVISMASLSNKFDTPVTFGCALDENGSPFRFFKGRISNMHVIVDDSITLD